MRQPTARAPFTPPGFGIPFEPSAASPGLDVGGVHRRARPSPARCPSAHRGCRRGLCLGNGSASRIGSAPRVISSATGRSRPRERSSASWRSCRFRSGRRSAEVSRSPGRIPLAAAGPPGSTWRTRSPSSGGSPTARRRSSAIGAPSSDQAELGSERVVGLPCPRACRAACPAAGRAGRARRRTGRPGARGHWSGAPARTPRTGLAPGRVIEITAPRPSSGSGAALDESPSHETVDPEADRPG